jgi:hypothetical protein
MNITLTFDDSPDGKVKVVCNPPAEWLIKKAGGKDGLSNAEAMVVILLSRISKMSRERDMEDRRIEI